jgi:hypothetical protein
MLVEVAMEYVMFRARDVNNIEKVAKLMPRIRGDLTFD